MKNYIKFIVGLFIGTCTLLIGVGYYNSSLKVGVEFQVPEGGMEVEYVPLMEECSSYSPGLALFEDRNTDQKKPVLESRQTKCRLQCGGTLEVKNVRGDRVQLKYHSPHRAWSQNCQDCATPGQNHISLTKDVLSTLTKIQGKE